MIAKLSLPRLLCQAGEHIASDLSALTIIGLIAEAAILALIAPIPLALRGVTHVLRHAR